MDMGDGETDLFGNDILEVMGTVESTMRAAGFGPEELRYQIIKDGAHNEEDWRARTVDILLWLNRKG